MKKVPGLGERIKKAIVNTGLNQQEIAEKLDVGQAQLSKWVNEMYSPSADALLNIATMTGISLDWLLTGKGQMIRIKHAIPRMPKYFRGDYTPGKPPESEDESIDFSQIQKEMGYEAVAGNLAMRVNEAREKAGLSMEVLAKRLDMEPSALEEFENGEVVPDAVTLNLIASELECDPGWLLAGEGLRIWMPKAKKEGIAEKIPDENYVFIPQMRTDTKSDTGLASEETTNMRIAFRKEWLEHRGEPRKMFLIRVQGDSMELTLQSGDVVLVDRNHAHLGPAGGIYVITLGGAVMVKRVQVYPKTGKVEIISDNPRYKTIDADVEEIIVHGKVIWFIREMER